MCRRSKKKINDEIESLFPDFKDSESSMVYFTKMKRYILLACSLYQNETQSEQEIKDLQTNRNWFLIKDGAKKIQDQGIEIERNFLSLLAFLELKEDVSVVTFYSKLDYINKKNKRESQNLA